MRMWLIGLVLLTLYGALGQRPAAQSGGSEPWVTPFTPARHFWVTPNGGGDGRLADPMSLAAAVAQAQPGDLYWLLPGTYEGGRDLLLTNGGLPGAPVVYRACPNGRATLDGGVGYLSADTWLWGLEITNLRPPMEDTAWVQTPDGPIKGGSALVNVRVPGGRLINNVIHDSRSSQSGIGGWDGGPGQVFYGNVVSSNGHDPDISRAPHGAYSQNDFSVDGYKYFVNNIFLDHAEICGEKCYNFHAHSQGVGLVSGFYLTQNIMANGRVSIGGANAHYAPSDNHIVTGNFFYNAGKIQLGFRKPWQGEFSDNYVAGNSGVLLTIWGRGETAFPQNAATIVRGNTFVHNERLHHLDLYAMTTTTPLGAAGLRPDDIIDDNYYGEGVRAKYWVDDEAMSLRSLEAWQAQSAIDRGATGFDSASRLGPDPMENAVFLLPNAYEPGRAHLAVFNWSGAVTTTVDLTAFMAPGDAYVVRDARDFYGQPVAAGRAPAEGGVTVPTPSSFHAFVIVAESPVDEPCAPSTNTETAVTPLHAAPVVVAVALSLVMLERRRRGRRSQARP